MEKLRNKERRKSGRTSEKGKNISEKVRKDGEGRGRRKRGEEEGDGG